MNIWTKRLTVSVVILGLAVGAYAAYPLAKFMYGWQTNGPPALHRLPVSEPTARLQYGPTNMQVADLRIPSGKGPFPLAVVIHGGCFLSKVDDKSGTAPLADALTERGIATLNVEYRKLGDPGGGWPNTFLDIGSSIDSIRDIAVRYPVDLHRVSLVGHSSGAFLALWAASRVRLPVSSEIRGADPFKPSALVVIDGPTALAPYVGRDKEECDEPVIVPLMGGSPAQFPDRYRAVDGGAQLPLGMRQGLVPAMFAREMADYVARAKRSGDFVEVYKPATPYHFRIINPERDEGRQTLELIERLAKS